MRQKYNKPNYSAFCMVFPPSSAKIEAGMAYEQVCSPGKRSVERINDQIVEAVERLHSKTGLRYRLCLPTDYTNPNCSRGCRYVNIGW